MTLNVGLIGRGISASRSPALHETEARAQGLDLSYQLFDTDIGSRRLSAMLDHAQGLGFRGLNITFPYKQAVIGLLDELSPEAKTVGAVNTVLFNDGLRIGHNTDFLGFAAGFREGLPNAALDRVLLLGAGGAGSAVAQALIDLGVGELLIYDRDMGLSFALAGQVGERALVAEELNIVQTVSGLVNATPMGMESHPGSAIPTGLLRSDLWVADIVYFPLETQLLRDARGLGCATLSGAGMAVHQAALAFELFTGLTPDTDRMRAAFEAM